MVPRKEDMDLVVRQRLRGWLLWYRRTRYQDATDADMAKALGLAGGTLSALLSGKRTPGLDVLVKLHRVANIPADLLLGSDPPAQR
jgi:transcriptional regulator with XRE-family HTH domain